MSPGWLDVNSGQIVIIITFDILAQCWSHQWIPWLVNVNL